MISRPKIRVRTIKLTWGYDLNDYQAKDQDTCTDWWNSEERKKQSYLERALPICQHSFWTLQIVMPSTSAGRVSPLVNVSSWATTRCGKYQTMEQSKVAIRWWLRFTRTGQSGEGHLLINKNGPIRWGRWLINHRFTRMGQSGEGHLLINQRFTWTSQSGEGHWLINLRFTNAGIMITVRASSLLKSVSHLQDMNQF